MNAIWFLLFLAGAVGVGIWFGVRADQTNTRINQHLSEFFASEAVCDAADMATDGDEL